MKTACPQTLSRLIGSVARPSWLVTSALLVAACGAASATGSGGRWEAAAPMSEPRSYHTATRLQEGSVLLAGGFPGLASAGIYDPLSRRSHASAPLTAVRFRPSLSPLSPP